MKQGYFPGDWLTSLDCKIKLEIQYAALSVYEPAR
jgi:hypothetical protein